MLEIKTRFVHSRPFHPKFKDIHFGKYNLTILPVEKDKERSSLWESLMIFEDRMRQGEQASMPAAEADYILSLLSLIFRMRIELKARSYNNVNTGISAELYRGYYKEYEMQITELPDIDNSIKKLVSFDKDILRQYIRACRTYNFALSLFGINNTLAFFLLCVTVECIANKVVAKEGTCDNFISFILANISEEKKKDCADEEEWNSFLKEIYYNHRSGFTHGGKNIPDASLLADRLNKKYVKNVIDGKEIKTPSLKWFESVVSDVLIGFLNKQPINESISSDGIKDLSLEEGVVNLKSKGPLEKGGLVSPSQFELD